MQNNIEYFSLNNNIKIPAIAFGPGLLNYDKKMPDFLLRRKFIEGVTSIVARFAFNEFQIEIFGQAFPIEEQRAYRHMIIEARLLDLFGDRARTNIRKIKLSGLKTEPAFGRHFRLVGDPYKALLELEDLSDNDLLMRFSYDIKG